MLLTRWLNKIVGRLRSARTRTRSNSQRRSSLAAQIAAPNVSVHVEPLEDRRLLAAVIGGLDGDSLSYSGSSAVVIDQGTSASVTGTIAIGGTLTVSVTSGGDTSEDVLSIRNEGTGLGQIGVSGSNITYSGLPLGTFTGGTGGSNLIVTFNAISLVAIGDLLQNITYQNTDAESPMTGASTTRNSRHCLTPLAVKTWSAYRIATRPIPFTGASHAQSNVVGADRTRGTHSVGG